MAITIKVRRGTATQFATNNPTLAAGEPGYETDFQRLKIGDGVKDWANLDYIGTGAAGGPPIAAVYIDVATLIAARPSQVQDFIYFVIDATDDPQIGDGYGHYHYLGTSNNDLTDYALIGPDAFNWNRAIRKNFLPGTSVGGNTVTQGLETALFGQIDTTSEVFSINPVQIGETSFPIVKGAVTANDGALQTINILDTGDADVGAVTFTPGDALVNVDQAVTASLVPIENDTNTYKVRTQTDYGSGNIQVDSFAINITAVYPFLSGTGVAGLTQATIYAALDKTIASQVNLESIFVASDQAFYFGFPNDYGDLIDIVDMDNGDSLLGSFFPATPQVFLVDSTGLSVDWTKSYKVYESVGLASATSKRIQFFFTNPFISSSDDIAQGDTNLFMTSAERIKLAGISPPGPILWGGIIGTLSDQVDLQLVLDGKAQVAGNDQQDFSVDQLVSNNLISDNIGVTGGMFFDQYQNASDQGTAMYIGDNGRVITITNYANPLLLPSPSILNVALTPPATFIDLGSLITIATEADPNKKTNEVVKGGMAIFVNVENTTGADITVTFRILINGTPTPVTNPVTSKANSTLPISVSQVIATTIFEGDLVTMEASASALGVNIRGDLVSSVLTVVKLIDEDMSFKGAWSAGEYQVSDTVTDEGWTMVANRRTSDQPSPQPVGIPAFSLPSSPIWIINSLNPYAATGQRYTFEDSGWITKVRLWPASQTVGYSYVGVILDTLTGTVINSVSFKSTQEEWVEAVIDPYIVLAGAQIDIFIRTYNEAGTVTTTYQYTSDNNDPPPTGEVSRIDDVVNVSNTDDGANDRTAFLAGIIVGNVIEVRETVADDQGRYYKVSIISLLGDLGGYHGFDTSEIEIGPKGLPRNGRPADVSFITGGTAAEYVEITTHWAISANLPSWASQVNGIFEPTVGGGFLVNTNAYGADLEFQPATISTDWKPLASTAVSSSSGEIITTGPASPIGVEQGKLGDLYKRIDEPNNITILYLYQSVVIGNLNWGRTFDPVLEPETISDIDGSLTMTDGLFFGILATSTEAVYNFCETIIDENNLGAGETTSLRIGILDTNFIYLAEGILVISDATPVGKVSFDFNDGAVTTSNPLGLPYLERFGVGSLYVVIGVNGYSAAGNVKIYNGKTKNIGNDAILFEKSGVVGTIASQDWTIGRVAGTKYPVTIISRENV